MQQHTSFAIYPTDLLPVPVKKYFPMQLPLIIIVVHVIGRPAPQRAEAEGVLQSAGLQEAEETEGGQERGESTEEPPQA